MSGLENPFKILCQYKQNGCIDTKLYKKLLARFVETLTEEWNIPIAGGGSTTFKRQDLERGLEPDECFYIEHEPNV